MISMVRQRVEEADARAGEEANDFVPAAPRENAGAGEEGTASAGETNETGPAEAAGTDDSESRGNGAGAGNGSRQGSPRGNGAASGAHSSSALGDYIRGLCRDAWGQQIRFLIGIQAFDEAELMLDFSEVQWFAQQDLLRWRRELFTSKVEALIARATEAATQEGGRSAAIATLYQAREAAMEGAMPTCKTAWIGRSGAFKAAPTGPRRSLRLKSSSPKANTWRSSAEPPNGWPPIPSNRPCGPSGTVLRIG